MRTLIGVLSAAIAIAALAQESKVQLKEGPGREKANACLACHSVDYIQMNSRFMDKAAWTASVNKMINAFGAPIQGRAKGPKQALRKGKSIRQNKGLMAFTLPYTMPIFRVTPVSRFSHIF